MNLEKELAEMQNQPAQIISVAQTFPRIGMMDIMRGLKIDIGDIVKVKEYVLVCNDKYDLVDFKSGGYNSQIPNVILAMTTGKCKYCVYKVSSFALYEATNETR